MNIEQAIPGKQVVYVPSHAEGNIDHPDCEEGFITSTKGRVIFCHFWRAGEDRLRSTLDSEYANAIHLVVKDTRPQTLVDAKLAEVEAQHKRMIEAMRGEGNHGM